MGTPGSLGFAVPSSLKEGGLMQQFCLKEPGLLVPSPRSKLCQLLSLLLPAKLFHNPKTWWALRKWCPKEHPKLLPRSAIKYLGSGIPIVVHHTTLLTRAGWSRLWPVGYFGDLPHQECGSTEQSHTVNPTVLILQWNPFGQHHQATF